MLEERSAEDRLAPRPRASVRSHFCMFDELSFVSDRIVPCIFAEVKSHLVMSALLSCASLRLAKITILLLALDR